MFTVSCVRNKMKICVRLFFRLNNCTLKTKNGATYYACEAIHKVRKCVRNVERAARNIPSRSTKHFFSSMIVGGSFTVTRKWNNSTLASPWGEEGAAFDVFECSRREVCRHLSTHRILAVSCAYMCATTSIPIEFSDKSRYGLERSGLGDYAFARVYQPSLRSFARELPGAFFIPIRNG